MLSQLHHFLKHHWNKKKDFVRNMKQAKKKIHFLSIYSVKFSHCNLLHDITSNKCSLGNIDSQVETQSE